MQKQETSWSIFPPLLKVCEAEESEDDETAQRM